MSAPDSAGNNYSSARTRISRACVACQQKKQKCDGRTPSCRNCLRADRVCIIRDPSTKRQHPRGYLEGLEQDNASLKSHVESLEQRIKDLQANPGFGLSSDNPGPSHEIQTTNAMSFADGSNTHDSNSISAGVFGETPSSLTTQDQTNDPKGADDATNLEMLCLRSAGADPHYFGSSSAYSFTKIFSASLRAVRSKAPGMSLSGVADSFTQSRPAPNPVPLPDRSLTTMLTSAYFEQIHPQFPFLHRPTYAQWEEEVLQACEQGYAPEPTKAFFVYALSAIGALTGPLAGGSLPEGLYASAENLFEHVVKLNTLESIQAILCCAMYSIRSPVGVSVWLLSGLALRQCTELGLHRKMCWGKFDSNSLKTQLRRRIFWCCYNLDRAISVTLGRPQGITDGDINVEFPLDIDDENLTPNGTLCEPRRSATDPSTTMSAAIHTIRLRAIWAKIQSSIYPQVNINNRATPSFLIENLKQELDEWLEASPPQLPSNEKHCNAFGSQEWYDLMYHHSILLLYRYSLGNPREDPSSATFLACAQSGARLCTGYRQLYVSNRLTDTWASLHNLFLGGVTFIYCLWSSAETRAHFRLDSVSNICTACTVVLSITAERWQSAASYRNAFDMLTSATLSMLVETKASSTEPSFPILPTSESEDFSGYFADMADIGICTSVEDLLSTMLESQ